MLNIRIYDLILLSTYVVKYPSYYLIFTHMELQEILRELGLTPSETKVWLAIVGMGSSSVDMIAKRAEVPRTTTYSVLERLKKMGLVATEKKIKSHYTAQSIEALVERAEKEERAAKKRAEMSRKAVELLLPYVNRSSVPTPRLQIFEGKSSVRRMLYDYMSVWLESSRKHDGLWTGMQDHTFLKHYEEWIDDLWRSYPPEKMQKHERVHVFANNAPIEHVIKEKLGPSVESKRKLRPFPMNMSFESTLWVCGEYIITIQTRRNPHYATQMRDRDLARNLSKVFETLWTLTDKN